MRTILVSTIGSLLVAGAVSAAPASEGWAGGVIVKVDEQARTFDVRQGAAELTYQLAPDAEVKNGKQRLQPTELPTVGVGQAVRIRYKSPDGTSRLARQVTLLGARAVPTQATSSSGQAATHSPDPQ